MNKSILVAFAFAGILSACSSHPSDFRPGSKVSVDEVAPGTRETDIYNLNREVAPQQEHGYKATGDQTTGPDAGSEKQAPAEEKTTDAEHVENHQ